MISVIIPTMWQSDLLPAMIDKYLACDTVSEVLIIDNNPQAILPISNHAKIIYSGQNLYVNPSWNLGVNHASSKFILIVNDDLLIDNITDVLPYLSEHILDKQIVGLDFFGKKMAITPCSEHKHKNNFQGWGSFLFLKKSDYIPIPKELMIWYGDNHLWQHLSPCVLSGIKGMHSVSKTVSLPDFEHIKQSDMSFFNKKEPIRICHIIMSCNRPDYLLPTLESIHKINFDNCIVHRVLVDDYPSGRSNELFSTLCMSYNINELILNHENKGLSVVWTELYERLKDRGYDYVLHQEDDVIINHQISISDWIAMLNLNPQTCSAVLTRQPWYPNEEPFAALDSDTVYQSLSSEYRIEYHNNVFSPMMSLYPASIMKEPFVDYYKVNLNEGMIMQYFRHNGLSCAYVKDHNGHNLITHIGEHFTGKRILPGEPGWEQFKNFNPENTYCSRTGILIK